MNYGASAEAWDALALLAGLAEDLLPIVSNPNAKISPSSSLGSIGKTPSVYNQSHHVVGMTQWTQKKATPRDIAAWARQPDYGIGIQTRHLRALDIDVPDRALAGNIEQYIQKNAVADGPLRIRRRGTSGKLLLAFHVVGELPKRVIDVAGGIVEFLGNGQQFVAEGTHPDGSRYAWDDGTPEWFPSMSLADFESLWRGLVATFGIGAVRESRATTRPLRLSGANDPVVAQLEGMGVVVGSVEGRVDITCPWEHEHTTEGVPSSTSYFLAHTGGYAEGRFACLHAHCSDRRDVEFRAALGLDVPDPLEGFGILAGEAPEPKPEIPTKSRFHAIPAHLFAAEKPPGWVINGIIPHSPLVMLYGEPGSGKTFAALDMAAAIARGVAWHGRKTKQGSVLYVAAEAAGGLRSRLHAYAKHNVVDLADLDIRIVAAVPAMLEEKQVRELALTANEHPPLVIILDTQAQVTAGGNENSAEDMGKFLKHCGLLHKETKATILLIHHSGKDASRGARGWSGLRGAMDAQLECVYDGTRRELVVTKQKDAAEGERYPFALTSIETDILDEDNDPVSSCVVTQVPDAGPVARGGRRAKSVPIPTPATPEGLPEEPLGRTSDAFKGDDPCPTPDTKPLAPAGAAPVDTPTEDELSALTEAPDSS